MASSLREHSTPRKIFRIVYPVGIHFVITQLAALLIMGIYLMLGSRDSIGSTLLVTGLASLFIIPLGVYLMRQDDWKRMYFGNIWKITVLDAGIAFGLGMCYGQIGNTVIGLLNLFDLFGSYNQMMGQVLTGENFFSMLLWIGIAAPAAEELLFRGLIYRRLKDYVNPWAAMLISSLMFGIYHGNMIQFLYATFMGIIFVLLLERTRSMWGCILAHMGANIWSVVLTCYGETLSGIGNGFLVSFLVLLLVVGGIFGILYFKNRTPGRYSS